MERWQDLVRIRRTEHGRVQSTQSYPDYLDYRDQCATVQGLIAERLLPMRLPGPPAQLVAGAIVTGDYFAVRLQTVNAEMSAIASRLEAAYPRHERRPRHPDKQSSQHGAGAARRPANPA